MSTATTHTTTPKPPTTAKQNKLVPKLRFKEFDGDIEETLFGNHYSFYTTNSFSRDKLNYDKGVVRNIHYGDIHTKFQTHFHLTKEIVPFINEDVDLAKVKEESYCKVGDLVIADASEDYTDIGKTIELIDLNNEKVLAGLHTFLARPSSETTALGYISCLLKSWKLRKQIMTIAQGTKVLSLSTGRVSKLKLNIPSLPEQQKIAAFLSAVDEKIQQLTKKATLLEQYKKGVMQKLFSGKLRFKDENGNDYPDWEEKRLGEVFKERSEKGYSVMELLSVTMAEGVIKRTEIEGKDNSSEDKSNYKRVLEKDIVYNSMRMWQGANGVSAYDGIVSPAYTVLRGNDENCSDYFGYFFKMRDVIFIFQRYSQGLTSDTWNLKYPQFSEIKFLIPSKKEQERIADCLKKLDRKIAHAQNQIEKMQTFKKGLLQQMFV